MSRTLTVIKDFCLWQVDSVERHPWLAVGAIWILAVLAIVF